ncbi:HAMP domain-containing sensor histidine kinase [Clostridiaceae bacterium M8S5]|nr:HAMP domain-containing sensor histidine kinase [Clostridiaceae bacterium M8S5]
MIVLNILIVEKVISTDLENRHVEEFTKANMTANRLKHYSGSEYDYHIAVVQNIMYNLSKDFGSRILMTNNKGVVVADSYDKLVNVKLNHREINEALKGKNSTGTYYLENIGNTIYTAVPIYKNEVLIGAVLLSTSIDDIFIKMDNLKKTLYLIYIICAVITTVIGIVMSDYLLSPIKKFTKTISNMSMGKLGQIVTVDTNDEFKRLANTFNLFSTQLSQVDMQRKDFVANVSHELKTPLCAIKLLSGSLLLENEVNVDIYKDFLTDIDSEVDRLTKIIDNLLELVNLDSKKITLNYQTVYINYLLEKIIQRMKPIAKEKDIAIKYDQIDQVQMDVDVDKMHQSIINIIHNAIKYTPNGGKIVVSLSKEENNMVIEVKDTGIGIPEKDIEHIFERFYRVDKARTRNTGGTGLGLSIAHQIVALHQGFIDIKSVLGKGTSFFIRIPIDSQDIYQGRR